MTEQKQLPPVNIASKHIDTPSNRVDQGEMLYEIRKDDHEEEEKAKNPAYRLADMLMDRYHFKATTDNLELFVYYPDDPHNPEKVGGIYRNSGALVISQVAQSELGAYTNTSQINEAKNIITRYNLINRVQFDSDPDIINVKNGLLNLKTLELKPHTQSPFYPAIPSEIHERCGLPTHKEIPA